MSPRRRERKNIASGVAHVSSTFNNTMITITDAHVFILVDDSRAIVIPRQGFADTKQYEQVKVLVMQYQRNS